MSKKLKLKFEGVYTVVAILDASSGEDGIVQDKTRGTSEDKSGQCVEVEEGNRTMVYRESRKRKAKCDEAHRGSHIESSERGRYSR